MARHSCRFLAATTALAFSAAGCQTMGRDTAIGAGVGTLAGAGIGALAGGKKGALIGAGVGALAGGSVGLYLDKQRKDLEKVAEVKKTENGLVVQMAGDILFDTNSAILKPPAVDEITKVGDVIAKYSDDRVRIEGHTDSTGAASANEQLSQRRAEAVKQVLLSRGVQERQMLVQGLGETRPVADNKTAEGRARNRRVELHIDVPNPS
jgi:outer membrane protein OmpA-like peptidoglycan-associated protein